MPGLWRIWTRGWLVQTRPDALIVEGLMALHVEEIRKRLDMRVFIELEADVRALRRLLRDMNGGRGSTDPQWIATYYQECARVGHNAYVEPSRVYADLIVRGDADFARVAPLLAGAIAAQADGPRRIILCLKLANPVLQSRQCPGLASHHRG